jgi:HAD superfamily hydrolase (TIGR01549 family)
MVNLVQFVASSPFLVRMFYFLPAKMRLSLRRRFSAGRTIVFPGVAYTNHERELLFAVNSLETMPFEKQSNYSGDLDWAPRPLKASLGNSEIECTEVSSLSFHTVSFDFWDTLVGRIRPAESVKRLTALRASFLDWKLRGFSGQRTSAAELHIKRNDEETRLVNAKGEASAGPVLKKMIEELNQGVSWESLLTAEVEDEIEFTMPLVSPEEVMNWQAGKRVVVSDHYLDQKSLRLIAQAHQLEQPFQEFFVSSEMGKTKRDQGRLFAEAGLGPDASWAHIGDNPSSDVHNAKTQGASAFLSRRNRATSWNGRDMNVSNMADDITLHLGADGAAGFLVELSGISYGLVSFAIEEALRLGKEEVVYLSREGETLTIAQNSLREVFEEFDLPWLPAKHMPVSRISSFFPSFGEDLESAFTKLSHQYPVMTGRAIQKTLGLPEELADLIRIQIGFEEQVRTTTIVSRLSSGLRLEVGSYLKSQKHNLQKLMNDRSISPERTLLGDLGWRGTIQDSLSRIAGSYFSSVYLGLFRSMDGSKADSNKLGLLFDESKGRPAPRELTFFGPLERAFTISCSQVIRYENHNGEISPVVSNSEDAPSAHRATAMKTGFPQAVKETARALISAGLFGSESSQFVTRLLQNWILRPSAFQASTWFDESHAEGFGVGDSVHYAVTDPSEIWAGPSRGATALEGLRSSLWPQGYLAWAPVEEILNAYKNREVIQ